MDSAVRELGAWINGEGIDLVVAGPYVSMHNVPENDNTNQALIARCLSQVAVEGGCALLVDHHMRKGLGGVDQSGDADAIRGASSIVDVARIAYTLVPPDATRLKEKHGVDEETGRSLVRLADAKLNYGQRLVECDWFRFVGVCLKNADDVQEADCVGVLEPYELPAALGEPRQTATGMSVDEFLTKHLRPVMDGERDPMCCQWRAIADKVADHVGCGVRTAETVRNRVSSNPDKPNWIKAPDGDLQGFWVEQGETATSPKFIRRRRL